MDSNITSVCKTFYLHAPLKISAPYYTRVPSIDHPSLLDGTVKVTWYTNNTLRYNQVAGDLSRQVARNGTRQVGQFIYK